METVWFGLVGMTVSFVLCFGLNEKVVVVVVVMMLLVAFPHSDFTTLESIVVVKKTRFLLPRNVAVQSFLELLTTSLKKLDVCLNNPFGPMRNDFKRNHEEVDIPGT